MGYAITDKSHAIFRIADYAAIIYVLSQKLLAAGTGHDLGKVSPLRNGVKFDVTSLLYERTKNDLLDAIATARAADFQDIPFFLSHEALLQVKKRLASKTMFRGKNQNILILANHQVFICNIEDVLDRATNHNYDSFQSKKGYIGDRIDIILKLKSTMAEYASSQRALESDVPQLPADSIANITKLARIDREQSAIKDALKKSGWLLQKAQAIFDLQSLADDNGKISDPMAAVFLLVHEGRILLQSDRLRWQIQPRKQDYAIHRSSDTAILAKFMASEIQQQLRLGNTVLRVELAHGALGLNFAARRPSAAKPTIVAMADPGLEAAATCL